MAASNQENNPESAGRKPTKSQLESSATKPAPCKIRPDSIPQELKDRNQWVLWAYRRRKGKWTKVPYQPGAEEARADDPSTWTRFDHVVKHGRFVRGSYDGIGYEFSADDPYTGIDLDDSIDPETNKLKPWAQAIVGSLNSYTEKSPSGTGVKIWVKARKPSNDRSRTK